MSTRLSENFRCHVREKLSEFGWNQQDLANATGKQKQYVSFLLTGRRQPGLDTLELFAEALDVEPSWLISDFSEKLSV